MCPILLECGLLDSILKDDEPFQSATNALQRPGSTMLELNKVRTLVDTLIAKVTSVESCLKTDADIATYTSRKRCTQKVSTPRPKECGSTRVWTQQRMWT